MIKEEEEEEEADAEEEKQREDSSMDVIKHLEQRPAVNVWKL